jgi:deazaflavin-dependent oxidoreductase (nitroreductase family)
MRRRLFLALSALGAVLAAWWFIPNRWYYRDRRPTSLGKGINGLWSWAAGHGLTPATWPGEPAIGTVSLEVRGRRSGRTRSNVVTWVQYDGDRYLVSMLGDHADWVRNVRAADGAAVIRHGGRQPVRLVELPVEQRAPVLRAYLKRTAIATRPHLGLDPDAPLEEFGRIAERHPVFRVVEDTPAC